MGPDELERRLRDRLDASALAADRWKNEPEPKPRAMLLRVRIVSLDKT